MNGETQDLATIERRIKKVGQRIFFYRRQRGLTQKELAKRADVSQELLSKMENAGWSSGFSVDDLYKVATVLEIEPHYLLMPIDENLLDDD